MEATLDHRTVDALQCRRVAQTLGLDAVGVVRSDAGGRSLTWWSASGSPTLPLDVDSIVDGRVDGWLVVSAEDAVVVGRLTERSSPTSVGALRTLLADAASAETTSASSDTTTLDAERARWAFAIHDGLTQIVTSAVLDLEWRARQVDRDPADAGQALTDAATELRVALDEVRGILAVVTPDAGHEASTLDDIVRQAAERWHLPASWSVDGDLGRVPAPVMDAATSVIRESVANAAKHSSTRRVAVHVAARPTEMEVSVEDTGRGFRPHEAGASGHLGLAMMRRRVEELHGTLDIESEPGRGTRVVARLPVGEGETP